MRPGRNNGLAPEGQAGEQAFWVRWRDGAELAQQTVQAALVCGLPEAELEAARAGQASLPDVVWRQLGRVLRWLLVVDNADEPHEIGSARRGSRWPTIAAGSVLTAGACWW